MIQIRKTLFIGFLVTTILSILFLSYTMYLVFGTAKAVRSLTVSISDIKIDEDLSEASFLLLIHNPSTIHLGLFFHEVKFNFKNKPIDERTSYSHKSTPLPSNEVINLNLTIPLEDQNSYSSSGWTLQVRLMFHTPLPGHITHIAVLEK